MLKKIGPYRVEERLGVGGMGEVYKAFDDRLDRWVAIKRIRPDKEAAEDNRERFVREARSTARINHPGIVHVYDIFKDGESLCIVMEYVEGRSLDTMVMEGALKPAKVLKLGFEIATGLAEAHARGIIHRDLKVENIIINEAGNAKILDFGLAKPILSNEMDPDLTSKGQLVGTSRAMSPEYVSGEEIDQRSDLFSLGVLLYETATGHSPFKAQNTLATLKQVMVHEQTSAVEMNSEVPIELSQLIDRLLAKDPEDRPQSAQEVADELGLLLEQLSSGAITKPASGRSSVNRRGARYSTVTGTNTATATAIDFGSRSRRLGAVIIFAILLAVVVWFQLREREDLRPPEGQPEHQEEKDLIVVADFDNKTGDPRLDVSLAYAFRVGLEQSRHAEVLSQPQVRAALQRMERSPDTLIDRDVGIELSRREGARALITGSVVKIGDVYTLNGTIVDPQGGRAEFTSTADAESDSDLVSAVQGVTREIRQILGESLSAIQKTAPLEKVTTRNIEALQAYSLGVAKIGSGDPDDAVPLLEQSLRLDPDFAMAHAKLGVSFVSTDPEKALKHLEKAWSRRDRLTSFEELYVEGWLARFRSTQKEEIRIWSLLSQLHPNHYLGHLNVGMANWLFQYRFEDAVTAFERALHVSGPENYPIIHIRLGRCQTAAGQYDQAFESFRQVEELGGSAVRRLVRLLLVTQEYEEARGLIEKHADGPDYISYRQLLSYYWAGRGNFEKAVDLTEQNMREQNQEKELLAGNLALIAYLEILNQGDLARARIAQAGQKAMSLIETAPSIGRRPPGMKSIAMLAKIAIKSDHLALAEKLLFELRQSSEKTLHSVDMSYTNIVEAELNLANGRPQEALSNAEEALAQAESIQARETLARIHERLHSLPTAVIHYRWIIQHRGRAFMEGVEDGGEAIGVVDWNLAHYHIGRLLQEMGETEEALRFFHLFVKQWSDGKELALVKNALVRLRLLEEQTSKNSL